MLNKRLNRKMIKDDYQKNDYVRIENFLDIEYVKEISHSIFYDITWDLCYLSEDGPISIKDEELAKYTHLQSSELNNKIMTRAQKGFSYFYYRSDLVNSTNKVLLGFYNDLCSDEFIDFCREITGVNSIETVNGQLACFSPGCFLRKHTDETDKEHRVAAYVINFTPVWNSDWGGNLHLLDGKQSIIDVLVPLFNSVTIFKVPALHYVSQVANFATGRRFTATGWMLKLE